MRWDLNALRGGGPPSEMAPGVDLDLRLPPGVGTSFLGLPPATLPAWVSRAMPMGQGCWPRGHLHQETEQPQPLPT